MIIDQKMLRDSETTNLNTSICNGPSGDLGKLKLLCFVFIRFGRRVHSGSGTSKNVAINSDQKVTAKQSNVFVIFIVKSLALIQK